MRNSWSTSVTDDQTVVISRFFASVRPYEYPHRGAVPRSICHLFRSLRSAGHNSIPPASSDSIRRPQSDVETSCKFRYRTPRPTARSPDTPAERKSDILDQGAWLMRTQRSVSCYVTASLAMFKIRSEGNPEPYFGEVPVEWAFYIFQGR